MMSEINENIENIEQNFVPEEEGSADFTSSSSEFIPGSVVDRPITKEMQSNYLDYSMSVIVSRALPDSRDGLKPSQRRILVAMHYLGLKPGSNYRKSAKIAGDTSGDYHPHGDAVIYPTMVKLAQDFSTRYPLIDGQGNFGSIDGDTAAAMRYTEARMSKVTLEMLEDLEKGTVTWQSNYDGTKYEPTVLPTRFPNLICNGTDGIAVGMATKLAPHNLTEVMSALRAMAKAGNSWEGKARYNDLRKEREALERIPRVLNSKPLSFYENYLKSFDPKDHEAEILAYEEEFKTSKEPLYPKFESELSPSELLEYVPAPDFPLGATVYDQKEILNAYATGRGRFLMRANSKIEESAGGRMQIVITDIPYQVNKATLSAKIAELVTTKKVIGIADIRDESTIKEGIRLVVILKKDVQPKSILNKLYKYTQMQMSFSANMIALVDQEPHTLSLKRMLELFISFRMNVIIRRHEFDLAQARYRGHILEGLLKALDMLDEVIATIRASKTQEDSKTNLIQKFDFTEVQAQAILDMQLRRLAALEREKLQDEFKSITEMIKEYNKILGSQEEILRIIDEEFARISEVYGDKRRTKIIKGKVGEFSEEDLVASEDTFVTISRSGYIKRLAPDTYKLQKRGGKGVTGGKIKDGDEIEHAFSSNTHDDLLLFTNRGRVFKIRVFEIPEASRIAKGLPLVNLIQLEQNELVTSILTQDKDGFKGEDEIQEGQDVTGVIKSSDLKTLFMATKQGTVKKVDISEFDKIRSSGLICIKLDDGDELKWVTPTTGKDEIMLITKYGRSIRFKEEDVRILGRATRGVRGMKFKNKEDELISMNAIRSDEVHLFTLSESGYGKMTSLKEYPTQGRGGSGVFTFRVTAKTGMLAVARVMDHPNKEIFVTSSHGQVIRSTVDAIPTLSRQTSGVKVMSLKGDDKVSAMAVL